MTKVRSKIKEQQVIVGALQNLRLTNLSPNDKVINYKMNNATQNRF